MEKAPSSSCAEDMLLFKENQRALSKLNPTLAEFLSLKEISKAFDALAEVPKEYSISFTKEGLPLLAVRGIQLQSKYNPEREAIRALDDPASGFSSFACIFSGMGLAYYCLEYVKRFPRALFVIVEPDINIFLLCMKHQNLMPLFESKKALFLIGLSPEDCATAIDEMQESLFFKLPLFSPPALSKANPEWFSLFHESLRRKSEKRNINLNTLRRFGSLWLKNMVKNKKELSARQGIASLKGAFEGFPALLIAAGPTLDDNLHLLSELREKCVVIAADTALRVCLRLNIEPDFLVLSDPQYINYRHIASLSAPRSFLITDAATWPAVFRFKCRGVFLCSSPFPMGKFIEERTEKKGSLGAGGSVATTAWDFARYIGCSCVYAAGLDLSYPQGRTHFRGALFEEQAHSSSVRLFTAEQASVSALFSAGSFTTESASGCKVLTDKRLSLYAWWFESALLNSSTPLSLLSAEGIKIKGASFSPPRSLKSLVSCRKKIDAILSNIEDSSSLKEGRTLNEAQVALKGAISELILGLNEILALAKEGEELCLVQIKACAEKIESECSEEEACAIETLERVNTKIARHPARGIVASTFETHEAKNSGKSYFCALLQLYISIKDETLASLLVLEKAHHNNF